MTGLGSTETSMCAPEQHLSSKTSNFGGNYEDYRINISLSKLGGRVGHLLRDF